MTWSSLIWLANLALELAVFWRLVRLERVGTPLGVFISWLLLHDAAALTLKPILSPLSWTYVYWASHAVTYVLILALVAPARIKSLPGVYWLTSLVLTATAITNVWLYEPNSQMALALACGLLAAFSTLIGYVTHARLQPGRTWLGTSVWVTGQLVAASLPGSYGLIYPVTCAAGLAFMFGSTYTPVPLPTLSVTKLDHVRLPLSPRFLRKLLPV